MSRPKCKSLLFLLSPTTDIGTKDGSDNIKVGNRKRNKLRKILGKNRKKEHGTIGKNATRKKLRKAILRYKPINNIVNLGTTILTEGETKLLQKGLSFIPTPSKVPRQNIAKGLNEFVRKMKLQYHFFHHPTQKNKEPFYVESSWVPPGDTPPQLQEYFDAITEDIYSLINHEREAVTPNLSPMEIKAIDTLAQQKNIIIQRADKGGAIVIWPKESYLTVAFRQLDNALHYTKSTRNDIPELTAQIISFLTNLLTKQKLTIKIYEFLEPKSLPRTPKFYLRPKIHKPKIDDITPGRPIVSGCGSPTEKLSQYLDYYLKPIVQTIPLYIKDSKHFLQIIMNNRSIIPKDSLLATLDVKSLYTNIPQNEGIQYCLEALTQFYGQSLPLPINELKQMFEFILKGNYFEFKDQIYLQIHGTSMGTPMAPNFANIFMSQLENRIITHAPDKLRPFLWKRYIDDIIIIWQHGEQTLKKFIEHANSIHDTIKFEGDYSKDRINFLDTTIYFNDNRILESTLFIKPTDICTLLQAASFHPPHCKKGIIYSQALRYRRLITNDKELEKHLNILKEHLVRRGYDLTFIEKTFARISNINQNDLLFPDHTNEHGPNPNTDNITNNLNKVIPFIVPYDPEITEIGSILRSHWHLIRNNPTLQQVWNNSTPILLL